MGKNFSPVKVQSCQDIPKSTLANLPGFLCIRWLQMLFPTVEYEQNFSLPSGQIIAKWTKGGIAIF